MEPPAHDAALELQRKLDRAALYAVCLRFHHHQKQRTFSKGGVEKLAPKGSPFVAGHPYLAAAGIIKLIRNPAERRFVSRGWSRGVRVWDVAVKLARLDEV